MDGFTLFTARLNTARMAATAAMRFAISKCWPMLHATAGKARPVALACRYR